ncbi:MAG: tRNA (guanosine(46)-N7)-methyltransferase TrmB [Planctomycetaceae bacterium]|nr:tRNA (guanosine(46)-N7)-methyltransferase TrmB [Planctomycetaceae bacterium]
MPARRNARINDQGSDHANPTTELPVEPIDWAKLFGNANPVEIEVGMGKGLFLLNSAIARADTNFFGIEIVRKYQLYATNRFAVRQLPNVKTVCTDAGWVLSRFVLPASVNAVHVYFPDPWWKARHKKRRVFSPQFAAQSARIIREGGRLLIATDVEEYFGVMTGIVRAMPAFRELRAETSTGTVEEAGYQTNFERKARQNGTPVWRAEFERTAGPITEVADPAA